MRNLRTLESALEFCKRQSCEAEALQRLYETTQPAAEHADWCQENSKIPCLHVTMKTRPFEKAELEPIIQCLAGSVVDRESHVVEVCHGSFNDAFVLFARIEPGLRVYGLRS